MHRRNLLILLLILFLIPVKASASNGSALRAGVVDLSDSFGFVFFNFEKSNELTLRPHFNCSGDINNLNITVKVCEKDTGKISQLEGQQQKRKTPKGYEVTITDVKPDTCFSCVSIAVCDKVTGKIYRGSDITDFQSGSVYTKPVSLAAAKKNIKKKAKKLRDIRLTIPLSKNKSEEWYQKTIMNYLLNPKNCPNGVLYPRHNMYYGKKPLSRYSVYKDCQCDTIKISGKKYVSIYIPCAVQHDIAHKKAYKRAKRIVKKLKKKLKGKSQKKKAFILMNYLDKITVYSKNGGPYKRTAYGSLCNKKAVCGGYTQGYMYLCRAAGIICLPAMNYSHSHVWNYVLIKGKLYAVDTTWCDAGKKGDRSYFMKGTSSKYFYKKKSHKLDASCKKMLSATYKMSTKDLK